MIRCPSCGCEQSEKIVCEQCTGPLPVDLDLFAALGLERRLSLEPAELERIYHEISRRIHPDRFANSPQEVREASLKSTALVTRAYRTLRDPVSRGLYWLELHGTKLAEDNKQVPSELAALVFEVQEQLAELRDTEEPSSRQSLLETIAQSREAAQREMDQAREQLVANFAKWDQKSASQAELLAELKALLSRIAYLRTLLRDIDREIEPSVPR